MRHFKMLVALIVLAVPALGTIPSPADAGCAWSMFGRDLGRSMAQTASCSQINLTNVETLHTKWVFKTAGPVTAQPAVVDNVVYVGSADGTFYALPADAVGTPEPIWSRNITHAFGGGYGAFVSSPAVATIDGTKVVVVGGGARLYVFDAADGAILGSLCTDPRPTNQCVGDADHSEVESSPAIVAAGSNAAHIYFGMDYNEGGLGRAGMVRATLSHDTAWHLTADWKFDPEGLRTWTGADTFTGGGAGQGCGNTWTSPSVDPANNLVFFDTSNCDTGRYNDHTLYGGESVFAIDMDSGALVWCYSPRPVNDADLDFGATANLLPNGRVGVGGKDGTYYSFDRAANQAASTDASTACRGSNGQTPNWATTVATGGSIDGIIGTSAVGQVNGAAAVFATNAIPMPDENTFSNPQYLTTLHAIDAATGDVLWNAPNVAPAYAGPTYANGLVFMPNTFDMNFTIFNADLGTQLWTFPMLAPSSPPALVGDSIYMGSGVEPGPGTPVLSDNGAVVAFQAVVPPSA